MAKISAEKLGAVIETQLTIVENQSLLYGLPLNYLIIGLGLISFVVFSYYFSTGGTLVEKLTTQSISNTENIAVEVIKANERIVKSMILPEGPLMSSMANQSIQINTMTTYLHSFIQQKVLELSVQIEMLNINLSPVGNSDLSATVPNINSLGSVMDLIL